MYPNCKECGFTLIELIVTITILAIIVSIALPSYHSFMERQEHSQMLALVRNSTHLAKNLAVTHHQQIVICASENLNTCSNNQWDKGMLIFTDQNNNKTLDPNEMIHQKLKTNLKYGNLKWDGGVANPNTLTFMGDTGLPRGSQGSFHYCSLKTAQNNTRYVVNQMGHVRAEVSNKCQ